MSAQGHNSELPRVLIDTAFGMPSGKEWNVATGPALQDALNRANRGDVIVHSMEELQADLEEWLAEYNRTCQVPVSTAMAKRRRRPSWIRFAWRGTKCWTRWCAQRRRRSLRRAA